jgi:Fe-Mn family superoxide dismutase
MYTLPDLPYDYNALAPAIEEKIMRLHHEKHHAAYIKNVNDALEGNDELLSLPVEELIQNLDRVPENIRTKVRNNAGGHANHSLFWIVMTPTSGSKPSSGLEEKISTAFTDIESFKTKFSEAATGVFGSGWAWLTVDNGELKIETTPNQDNPLISGTTPLLGLDVWEHAYYLQYENRRPEYIQAWWDVVNWEEVSRRFDASLS